MYLKKFTLFLLFLMILFDFNKGVCYSLLRWKKEQQKTQKNNLPTGGYYNEKTN